MRTYSRALGCPAWADPCSSISVSLRSTWMSAIRYLPPGAVGIRYTTVKMMIHTMSTKCQ